MPKMTKRHSLLRLGDSRCTVKIVIGAGTPNPLALLVVVVVCGGGAWTRCFRDAIKVAAAAAVPLFQSPENIFHWRQRHLVGFDLQGICPQGKACCYYGASKFYFDVDALVA